MVRILPRATSERKAWLYVIIRGALAGAVAAFSLLGAVLLLASELLDYRLIVSLVVTEVPLGIFLWAVLGERENSARQRTIDAIEKARAITEFQHLEIHYFNAWEEYDYPALLYFVVNTKTKKGYYSPKYIHELQQGGVIDAISYKSDDALLDKFKKEEITLEKREPTPKELLIPPQ